MSLKKLPCEYKELQMSRFKHCFGDLSEDDQLNIMKSISKITELVKV